MSEIEVFPTPRRHISSSAHQEAESPAARRTRWAGTVRYWGEQMAQAAELDDHHRARKAWEAMGRTFGFVERSA